jgi:hypothetical protein
MGGQQEQFGDITEMISYWKVMEVEALHWRGRGSGRGSKGSSQRREEEGGGVNCV